MVTVKEEYDRSSHCSRGSDDGRDIPSSHLGSICIPLVYRWKVTKGGASVGWDEYLINPIGYCQSCYDTIIYTGNYVEADFEKV